MEVTKTRKVTFTDSLPRGTVGTFTHEGEMWFAYPQAKVSALAGTLDRTIGALDGVRDELIRWMNTHPEDAAHAVHALARADRGVDLAKEKAAAWTM